MSSLLPGLLMYLNISFLVLLLEYLVLIFFMAFIISLVVIVRRKKQVKRMEKQHQMMETLFNSFPLGRGLEENLDGLLKLFIAQIKGQGYYFYLLNEKNELVLKAFRYADSDQANITPSHSDLAPSQKEYYMPPVNIPRSGSQSTLVQDGEVPLVEIPVKGGKGVVRVGPVMPKEKPDYEMLNFMAEKLQPIVDVFMATDKLKNRIEVVGNTDKAVKAITDAAMNFKGTVHTIMGLCMRMINASGSCLFFINAGGAECISVCGLEKDLEDYLSQDNNLPKLFDRVLDDKDIAVLDKEKPEFFQIPSYLAASGMEKIFLVRVSVNDDKGIAVFWFNYKMMLEQYRIYGLQMVLGRLGDAAESYHRYQEMAMSYLEVLKVLVDTVDSIDPYMTGYSDLMSRYAGIIAKEMKLDDQEVKDIVLAAFLSNIGIVGMSTDLLLKDGRYSDMEYETMKLHCDVGASIVEVTLGSSIIAAYIRYHHERMDGFGYPSGLKGKEIPLGARIIAVAQLFIAKTMGRKYRDPLSYEQAINLLKGAAGTQLDEEVVDVLINWFKKKQSNSSRVGKSLGPCWEMRCSPENVCAECPAYKNTEKNCWEYQDVKCLGHGNTCATCFVYTEYLYRTQS